LTLKDELKSELKAAMKAKDKIAKATITMVRAAILQVEKDKKIELDDDAVLEVISKQVKQRKDALKEFEKAGREDLVQQTQEELQVLQKYLPQQLTEAELEKIIDATINDTGAETMQDMGKVMGAIIPKVKGRADGSVINKMVKDKLS
jgi:uncharacterized protein YqeY